MTQPRSTLLSGTPTLLERPKLGDTHFNCAARADDAHE